MLPHKFSSRKRICAFRARDLRCVGLQSTATVHYHLNALRQDGLIEMDGMKKRTITLADSHRADRIPVVGVVTAGVPILAVEILKAICVGRRSGLLCAACPGDP